MTDLTNNQTAVLNAVRNGAASTADAAKAAGVVWHSANVAVKALALRGLVSGSTPNLTASGPASQDTVGTKTLTRNQFAAYVAVATGATTTGQVARRAGIVWHSANVAVKSLVAKGMIQGTTGTLAARAILDLGSVTFTQAA